MNSGPSKEQLESLFKTSRKYFDELAKEYYAKDRDFYNKNFAPFYNNPFVASKKGGRPAILVVAIGLAVLIAGLAFLILMLVENSSENKPVRQTEEYRLPEKIEKEKSATSVKDSVKREKIRTEELQEELIQKENTGKREVRKKPMERQR
jgi:hypothetical protein